MRPSIRLAVAAASAAGLLSARIASAGYPSAQVIVTSGTTVAGTAALNPTNPGEVFGALSGTPAINDSGMVAFEAPVVFSGNISSGNSQNNYGVFSGGTGGVNLLAQMGYLAPSASGGGTGTSYAGTFQYATLGFSQPILNAAGNTLFTDSLLATASGGSNSSTNTPVTSSNNSGAWSDRPGSLSLLVQSGNTSAVGGTTVKTFSSSVVQNPVGSLAYTTTTNDSAAGGLVIDTGTTTPSLAFVARGSTAAPGTNNSNLSSGGYANFSNGGFLAPVINSTGQVAFAALLTTGTYGGSITINANNDEGIWKTVGGAVQLVAQGANHAPGLASGDLFGASSLGNPDMNNAGQTTFKDTLVNATSGGDVTTGNSGTIWSEGGGTLHLVARLQVTTAPGTGGSVFNSSFGTPVIDDAGQVAFSASFNGGTGITAANNSGLFVGDVGSLALIAQKGMQAPGMPAGVDYTGFLSYALNSQGDLAFGASLSNGLSAVFAQDPSGTVDALLYNGEQIQISPGVFGNVSGFSLVTATGGEDGKQMDWNDSDTFASSVQFNTNGVTSTAVVEVTAVVPEPTSIAMLALATPLFLARRRRNTAIKQTSSWT